MLCNLSGNSALCDLIGVDNIEEIKQNGSEGLKKCFSLLMHSKDVDINSCIAKLKESFNTNGKPSYILIFKPFTCLFPKYRVNNRQKDFSPIKPRIP